MVHAAWSVVQQQLVAHADGTCNCKIDSNLNSNCFCLNFVSSLAYLHFPFPIFPFPIFISNSTTTIRQRVHFIYVHISLGTCYIYTRWHATCGRLRHVACGMWHAASVCATRHIISEHTLTHLTSLNSQMKLGCNTQRLDGSACHQRGQTQQQGQY